MMAFYIKPPHGKISLSHLQLYAETRLNLLVKVSKCKGKFIAIRDIMEDLTTVTFSDCLIEGSKKDQVSHFILRMACSQNDEMSNFFIKTETSLFAYRLSCMTKTELHTMIKPIKRFKRYIANESESSVHDGVLANEIKETLSIIDQLTTDTTWEELINEYISGTDTKFMHVSFHHVADLVAKRLVHLKDGFALVPSRKLGEVLKVIFESVLRHGVKVAGKKIDEAKEDHRIRKSMVYLQRLYKQSCPRTVHGSCKDAVLCEEVDNVQHLFPPCMSHLHNSLREVHRLKHFSRIQYTLFLKEVGLPVNEGIYFWQSEYSKPAKSQLALGKVKSGNTSLNKTLKNSCTESSCSHSWEKDGPRYTYNIRHLYGLEGGRKNYRGHCCASLQSFHAGPGEQGGCPFKHFDREHLTKMLLEQGLCEPLLSVIHTSVEDGLYDEACTKYMCAKLLQHNKKTHRFQPPEVKVYGTNALDCPVNLNNNDIKIQIKPEKDNVGNNHTSHRKRPLTECLTLHHNHTRDCENAKRLKVHNSAAVRNCVKAICDINSTSEICLDNEQTTITSENDLEKTSASQSCYEHDNCPPSQKGSFSQKLVLSQTLPQCKSKMYNTDFHISDQIGAVLNGKDIIVNKPIDYYLTFKSLVEGLR